MAGRLEGKIALITGAGNGIGAGIARRFAEEGARVGVLDVLEERVNETVEALIALGAEALGLVCDVREHVQVEWAVKTLSETFAPINVVVNNAAVMPSGMLHETEPDEWEHVFAVNVRGAYLVNRAVIPQMIMQGNGSIIHIASVSGMLGLPGLAAYSTTKGALIALTRAMSTDYAPNGIRVNSVSPGTIDSPMLHEFLGAQADPDSLRAEFDAMHPIGRIGSIDEVANVVLFLASDESSFVTGANYTVDGGLSVKGDQPQD
ncbi:MAG: glucose 1-dehydrogenase [Chloroflexi bacterium]|nr:MAG: glucose 1-dehydrogenase [Chloroflexota bacterium]